jgi:hypothetical protein
VSRYFKSKEENMMTIRKTYIAALAIAGTLAVTAATPSFADSRWGYAAGGFAAGALVGAAAANANAGYYDGPGYGYAYPRAYQGYAYAPAPGYYGGYNSYSYSPTYDPENGNDPDPRIGGSFKMNSSGDD